MDTAKSFTSNIPRENSISKSDTNSSISEVHNNPITVTKCLSKRCTGFYTDSISEYLLIKCLDPKHNIDEAMGPDKPTAEDDTDTQPSDQLGLGVRNDNV